MDFRNKLIGAEAVAETLGISRTYAYEIIKDLNKELRKMGYLTIAGKVEGTYFLRRYFPSYEAAQSTIQQPKGGSENGTVQV